MLKRLLVALTAVGAISVIFASFALANGGWTHLGGDPLVPGGVNTRSQFVHAITSTRGQTAMEYAGLNKAERKAITLQVREGNFRPCSMKYGQTFWRMSFGINGTSVDKNVKFQDSRYMGGAPAWCVTAWVGGKDGYKVSMLMPRKCGNVSIPHKPTRKFHRVKKPAPKPKPKKPAPKPAPKPKPTPTSPGSCNITITNSIVNGNVTDCSTVTIIVTCGNVSQTFTGDKDTAQQQANTWQQANCTSTPPPTCQDKSAINYGGSLPCTYPPQKCTDTKASNYGQPLPCTYPQPPTFTMSWDTINDIPGGTCRPETLHVTSSVAGPVKINPNVGLVSKTDCSQPDSEQLSTVTLDVAAGTNDYVVYVYEPTDQSATSDTLTATPLFGGFSPVSTTFTVSHPTRA